MRYLTFFLLFAFSFPGFGQTESVEENTRLDSLLMDQADAMGQAFARLDVKEFLKYMHPELLVAMGGPENAEKTVSPQLNQMAAVQIKVSNMAYSQPSSWIKIGDSTWHCVLQQEMVLDMPDRYMTAYSSLVAVSTDNGATWRFAATDGRNITQMREILPSLSPNIEIPPTRKPEITMK